jgi:glycosyltransferase involved in cell wall biosynthesis
MKEPLISICIPTYKRVYLLKQLLDSISTQTYKNIEILINDNSPDDSVETLVNSSFAGLPIFYKKNQPTVSAGANCIKVMQRASGDWVKIMHDDDWFATPNALQQFVDAAMQSGKDFLFCATKQVWLDGDKKEDDFLQSHEKKMLDNSSWCLFYLNVIGHPSVAMTKRDVSIQYDADFNWLLDIDYYMRYLISHPGYHYMPQQLINIGRGETQETHKYSQKINAEVPEYFSLLSKFDPDLYLKDEYVFHRIWDLIRVFRIKSVDQIYSSGYKGALPAKIGEIIRFQQRIPRLIIKQPPWSKAIMKNCFRLFAKKYTNVGEIKS